MGLVEVTTRAERQDVAVEISNDGPVIPPAIVDKIYEPFFTTKPAGKGTGLGLGICAGIVERAGGAITLRNAPGRVAFVIWLPGMPQASPGRKTPDLAPACVESPVGVSEEAG